MHVHPVHPPWVRPCNHCHLSDPPRFLLLSTFNGAGAVQLARTGGIENIKSLGPSSSLGHGTKNDRYSLF
jgi:hypothetical protein